MVKRRWQETFSLLCKSTTQYGHLNSHHPSIRPYNHLSPWKQFEQRAPNFPFRGHLNQLWLGDSKVFPGHHKDKIPPPVPGFARQGGLVAPLPGARTTPLYTKTLPNEWTSHLIPKGHASHPPEKAHFCLLYPRSHLNSPYFYHYHLKVVKCTKSQIQSFD